MNNPNLKQTTAGIRIILYVASFLVLSVGLSLYFLSAKTDIYFSWTIDPPMTAAFLGAGYLASFLIEFLAAREKIWARARIAVPGVLAFTILTSIVTLIHLDKFHFDSPVFITLAGTWVWLFIYISVPIALSILWALQARQPGADPDRKVLLPVWLRSTLILQGLVMFIFGSAMLLIPEVTIPLWPWKLSVLTSRAIGAWGVGIGVIALHAAWENAWARLSPMFISYFTYGALQVINLLRYPDVIDWASPSAMLYTLFVISIFLAGAYGTWKTWQISN